MTVTGVTVPSSAKSCVIPTFLPIIPLIIILYDKLQFVGLIKQTKVCLTLILSKCLDLDIDARRKIQLHQRVDRFRRRIENVHKPLVRTYLELLTRFFIDV